MSDPFSQNSEKVEKMLIDALGDAICKTTGIDRKEHRQATDKQVDKLRDLECEVFHFGFFSDLIEGDTKAEAKALMNNIIPDFYKMPNQVSNTQLRLTSYIYYRALYNLTIKRIANYLAHAKAASVTHEHVNLANEIADKVEEYLSSQVDALARTQKEHAKMKQQEAEDEKLK